jgi:hypothetical protein
MINDPHYNRLRELSWQRKLTPDEEAALRGWLAVHPDAQADWELEAALNEALGQMAQAPVPSNFAARVLQAVELEEKAGARQSGGSLWRRQPWLRWLRRIAFAAIVLCAGMISYEQIQVHQERERIRAVEAVADISSVPGTDALKDYNVIQVLSTPADEDLLTALK